VVSVHIVGLQKFVAKPTESTNRIAVKLTC